MAYYIAKTAEASFDDALSRTKQALANEGFGVLTEIDVSLTLKSKLNVEFPRYVILGACNPSLAHQALLAENKIGVLLPCSVVVREDKNGTVEIATVDPVASMSAVKSGALASIAATVKDKLARAINSL